MKFEEFLEKFVDIFDETEPSEINAETKFKDLDEWSSLTSLMIVSFADEEYNTQISNDDIRKTETVKDLYEFLESRTK